MRNTAPKDAAEIEALETREWLESLDYVLQSGGPARVSRLLRELSDHARRNGVTQPFTANTPYINTISADRSAAVPRQPRDRAPHQEPGPLERAGDGRQGQQGSRTASAVTSRRSPRPPRSTKSASTTSSRARATTTTATSSTSRDTPRRASTRARSSKAGCRREKLENFRRELKAGGGLSSYPHPVADARLLGVPHGVDGPRPDHVDLPGALHALPGRSRPEEALELEGVGVPRRRRDRRARDRSARSRSRRARSSTT